MGSSRRRLRSAGSRHAGSTRVQRTWPRRAGASPEFLERANIEDREISRLRQFDFVLCFGMLYHLEIRCRRFETFARSLESACFWKACAYPRKGARCFCGKSQRRTIKASTKWPATQVKALWLKMLYRAGFTKVYRVTQLPDHSDFRETREHTQHRTVLLASMVPMDASSFRLLLEPQKIEDPRAKKPPRKATLVRRIGRFLASPRRTKYATLANRVRRIFPHVPIPLRLPCGVWRLAEEGFVDQQLLFDEFETMERKFVQKLLRRDMTVVDVGAQSRFERGVDFLRGREDSAEAKFCVVGRFNDGCNSLRPPAIA